MRFDAFAAVAMRTPFACLLAAVWLATPASAEFPWKASDGDSSDPAAYEEYMYITPSQYPPSDLGGDIWKYSSQNACEIYGNDDERCDPLISENPQELYGVTGASVDLAWQTTTGRPDVIIAVTDSGVQWTHSGKMDDLKYKTYINRGELPLPNNASSYDANGDGIFNLKDYEHDLRVADANASGFLDPEDLIFIFSDGIDQDGNGYVDDIAGWDFYEEDNDPYDENQFGHGSGESEDSVAEINNGRSAGVAPNSMVMHMRVGDSFIADINDFAEAAVYATDNGASVIQCALGTLNNTRFGQEAINYAYRRGVVLIASAADEEAGHHNLPAVLEHAVTVNSIGEPEFPEVDAVQPSMIQPSYLEFRGCTNYGAYITAAVPSNSCSSEATGRTSGMAALIYSAAKNAVAKNIIQDYGALDGAAGVTAGRGVSAEEVDQIIATTADDINFVTPLLYTARPLPETERFPGTEGWDPFFGYGRVNAKRMVQAVSENRIPPEADIRTPKWFTIIAPGDGPIRIEGAVAARRASGYSYSVQWAVWSWRDLNSAPLYTTTGVTLAATGDQTAPIDGLLATIDASAISNALHLANGFLGATSGPAVDNFTGRGDHQNRQIPDKFTIIVRLEVVAKDATGTPLQNIDNGPLTGVGTKAFYLHDDPALMPGFPRYEAAGGGDSARFVDIDNDGQDELIVATSNGEIHAYEYDGSEVPGWPARTHDSGIPYGAPGYRSGEITVPIHASLMFAPAVGDIDRDGNLEVVVGDFEGRVSVFDRHGQMLPGFPVRTDPAYSTPQRADREAGYYASRPDLVPGEYPGGALPNNPDLVPDLVNRKDEYNSTAWWVYAAPSLGNIDPSDDALEIIVTAADRHVYVFKADGSPMPGWPVMLRDPSKVAAVQPATHRVTNLPGTRPGGGAMIVTSAAIGDIDGDGNLDVVSAVNEQYREPMNSDDEVIQTILGALGEEGGNDRTYAVYGDGALHNGGPSGGPHPHANAYLPGWPVKVPTLLVDLLPIVGEGPNGSPVLGDVSGDGLLDVGVYGTIGPAHIFGHDGISIYGRDDQGRDRSLLMAPGGAAANSVDLPSIPALGGGIFTRFAGTGDVSYAIGAAGLGKLLDAFLPDDQLLSDNHLAVWDLAGTRLQLPAFPREVNDLQFFSTPASADIDGDGFEELLNGTAYGDIHALNVIGEEPGLRALAPDGWPKFTGGWHAGSPSVGDFDGDGYRDAAASTRDGWLFVWRGNGATVCDPASWPEWGHDGWNTNNIDTDAVRPRVITDLAATTTPAARIVVGAKVEGGGHIPIGLSRGNFGLNAMLLDGAVAGKLQYQDKNLGGIRIKSEWVDAVDIACDGTDVTIAWTAPGDDGPCGQAAEYDIRYATSPIDDATWTQATVVPNDLQPRPAGEAETFRMPLLQPGAYSIAVRAVDDAGNLSALSNVVQASVSAPGAATATFSGTATVDGQSGHAFTVAVTDNGDPGKNNDTFEIDVDTGYYAAGVLSGGNITIEVAELAAEAEAVAYQEPTFEMQTLWELLFGLDGLAFLLNIF